MVSDTVRRLKAKSDERKSIIEKRDIEKQVGPHYQATIDTCLMHLVHHITALQELLARWKEALSAKDLDQMRAIATDVHAYESEYKDRSTFDIMELEEEINTVTFNVKMAHKIHYFWYQIEDERKEQEKVYGRLTRPLTPEEETTVSGDVVERDQWV